MTPPVATPAEGHAAISAPWTQASWVQAWPIYPLLLFVLLLFVYPVAQILVLSLFDASGAPTAANYARIATTPVYLQTLVITFEIAGWTTFFALLAGYPVAYLMANAVTRTRDSLTLLVLMPFWTSFLVRTFAWMILLGRNGAVNRLLLTLGITDAPVALIFNFTGVMIGMVHAMMPLGIMAMLSVMQRIDINLVNAARTLGARGGQAFWRIYFRLSLPGVAAAGLLVFITALGFFITPALLGGRRETMISQVIITVVQELLNWRFAGALSVVLLAAAALVLYLYDRLLGISSLSGGAAASDSGGQRGPGVLGRFGGLAGEAVIAALGWLCDRAGEAWDVIFPERPGRQRRRMSAALLWIAGGLIIAFLCLPSLFVIPVSFTSGSFIEFPPQGLSLRWYQTYLGSPVWVDATVRSFLVAIATAALATVLGTAAAFVLVRQKMFGRGVILALLLAPLVLPRIIIAVALFYFYARINLVGTFAGLVLGHTILAAPYVVITVMAVLKTYDERLDQAAWSLGASKWRTLYHITLPQIRGGVIAGFLFAFITSFDELTIALFVTSGSSATLPRQMWNDLLLQVNPTLAAVSTVILVFVTVVVICAEMLRRRVAGDG
jgi:putative spermidine/putrescine transport system permease protein